MLLPIAARAAAVMPGWRSCSSFCRSVALMTPVLQPLLDLVAKSKDPTALMGKLTDAYPSMDTGKLEELLARMLFVAMIHGQLSASAETSSNA